MGLFYNRPFALACVALVGTAFLCYFLNATVCLLISLALLLAGVLAWVLFALRGRRVQFLAGLCLTLACLSALSSALLLHARCDRHADLIGTEASIEGTVLDVRETEYGGEVLEVSLYRLNGEVCYDGLYLRSSSPTSLAVGDSFRARVTCEEFLTGDTYDARAAALSDGIFGTASLLDGATPERLEDSRFSLRGTLLALREELAGRLSALVGGEEGALCVAFLLGDKDYLSAQTVLHFRRAGVSHLLALSGLHVSILISFLELLLRRLSCPRRLRSLSVILLALVYLLLTGCSLSTVRAVVMCCVLMLSFLSRRGYDSFTSLCAALSGILLITPWALGDLGMWMSFLAAGSIIVFSPAMRRLQQLFREKLHLGRLPQRLLTALVAPLLVGTVANLALAPIQGFFFGELSLASIPATLLLSYPLTAVLILSLITVVIPPVGMLARLAATLNLACAEWFSRLEGIVLPIGDAVSLSLLLLLTLSLLLIATVKLAPKRLIPLLMIPFALGIALLPTSRLVTALSHGEVEAAYVSAVRGSGEALVISRDGGCTVVDLSANGTGAEYRIAEAARAARCTEIGEVLLTSYAKEDPKLLAALSERCLIRRVRLPVPQDDGERALAEEIGAVAELRGIGISFGTESLSVEGVSDIRVARYRERNGVQSPLLFSFVCRDTRLTYTSGDLLSRGALLQPYQPLLEETEVLILGGRRTDGMLPVALPRLRTLILKSEAHGRGLPPRLLSEEILSASPKYKFE